MRPKRPFPHDAVKRLEELLKTSQSAVERRRVQCVYLRAQYEIDRIHAAYQKKVAKKTALTTTYRMLHRHGWRKRFGPRSGWWSAPVMDT